MSVGEHLVHQAARVPTRGGRNRFLYDPENGLHGAGNGLRTGSGLDEEAAGDHLNRDGHDTGEELVEHDYGDPGRVEVGLSGVVFWVRAVGKGLPAYAGKNVQTIMCMFPVKLVRSKR